MKKIQSLFCRNYDGDRLVRDEVVPGSEWVLDDQGTPTVKLDGTCCLIRDGRLFKRYEVKKGKQPPPNFEPAGDIDANTGKQQGWVPVGDGPEDKYHREAFERGEDAYGGLFEDGTYELVGPKIQGNPEKATEHCLCGHGAESIDEEDLTLSFDGIREFLSTRDIEGIVWPTLIVTGKHGS